MTVKELMRTAEGRAGLQDAIAQGTNVWSNGACLGYVIKALENLEYDTDEIRRVVRSMKNVFDWTSVDEAEKHYNRSQY